MSDSGNVGILGEVGGADGLGVAGAADGGGAPRGQPGERDVLVDAAGAEDTAALPTVVLQNKNEIIIKVQ